MREAIDAGVFKPGEQMPSTKDLSQQMAVSLVTAHRALQELVACGVLQRAQGKGTFVHDRYFDKNRTITQWRIGLAISRECSIGDFVFSHILEGIRRAAQEQAADLVLLRFGEDLRRECNAYLYLNPLPQDLEAVASQTTRRQPVLVVGARSHLRHIAHMDVDNVDVARQAVNHLAELGHTSLGYVGSADQSSSSRDRWQGFLDGCREHGIRVREQHAVRGSSWQAGEEETEILRRLLESPDRPTALFVAGYHLALKVYTAAAELGLRIPADVSIVAVDDPPSASHLSPPLTTIRQPLAQLGHAAATALCTYLLENRQALPSRLMRGQLIVRKSAAQR